MIQGSSFLFFSFILPFFYRLSSFFRGSSPHFPRTRLVSSTGRLAIVLFHLRDLHASLTLKRDRSRTALRLRFYVAASFLRQQIKYDG
jgi:hypothetical protein